ncbi:g12355 [Coccomyxa viridis]|uniref:G12355 protein n=1 Tax=Coccomyxa viridis TaxID=1274662 RepID=A0ABP1GCS9_9CHLO
MLSRATAPSWIVLWTALALLLAACSIASATSRRHLEQTPTLPAPFENLPALPFVSYQQQPQQQPPQQQQQQPPYQQQQQQQQPPYQQGPNNQQPQQSQSQQGPQQQGPQQRSQQEQASLDSLAMNSASQSSSAHAPSIGFGTSTLAANVGIQLPGYIQRAQLPQYAPAPAPVQGPAAYMPQEELQADAMAAASADGNKCLPLTKELVTGMCLPFMAQFQTDGARLAKLSERDFRQAIAIGPTPSDRCCRDAKDFTMAACACDPAAETLAPSILLTVQDLRLSARAAVMACPHYHITDPCAQA